MLHVPDGSGELKRARERLVFDEFLELLLTLGRCRLEQDASHAGRPKRGTTRVRQAQRGLPFQLTRAQRSALTTILHDLASPRVMHRLLEGDVGSGKTVVALAAMFLVTSAGYQAVMMAPTEILAEQHFKTIIEMLTPYGLNVSLLTGSVPRSEKKDIYDGLACGEIQILVGTHAIIQQDVR